MERRVGSEFAGADGLRGHPGFHRVAASRCTSRFPGAQEKKAGRVFSERVRPLCFLGLSLEVGEVTFVPLPLVMLVQEFPFPSTRVFPLRVSALFPSAADPKDPFPSYVGVPAPTKPKFGRGMQCNALSCSLSSAKEIRRGHREYVTEIGSCQVRRRFF